MAMMIVPTAVPAVIVHLPSRVVGLHACSSSMYRNVNIQPRSATRSSSLFLAQRLLMVNMVRTRDLIVAQLSGIG